MAGRPFGGRKKSYAQSYNCRRRKVGYLFQYRYKAILCDRDVYWLELVRYIRLNPGRLKVPETPGVSDSAAGTRPRRRSPV